MAWPNDLTQVSTNLTKEEFTVVKFAIDHELVEWGEGDLLGSYCCGPFAFNGITYELAENFELVTSMNRKEKE